MHRPLPQSLLVLGLILIGVAGCNTGSSTSTATTTPTTTSISEPPFTGTLTLNGSQITQFTTMLAGTVTATIATLTPDPPSPSGILLDLGTWNGISCTIQIETPNAVAGSTTTGTVAGAGTLCARIADGGGLITTPLAFVINIVHF